MWYRSKRFVASQVTGSYFFLAPLWPFCTRGFLERGAFFVAEERGAAFPAKSLGDAFSASATNSAGVAVRMNSRTVLAAFSLKLMDASSTHQV